METNCRSSKACRTLPSPPMKAAFPKVRFHRWCRGYRPARQLRDITDMLRTHHPRAVQSHVHEELVQVHVLLRVSVNQVMEVMPCNRDDRLAVELRVIKAIEEMDPAGA